jgi:hypothetical protein
MPISDSYHDSLIESLKDPHYAAVYLETHLEGDEYEFESELLRLAFNHVLEALRPQNLTPEQIKIQANAAFQQRQYTTAIGLYSKVFILTSIKLWENYIIMIIF